MHRVDGANPGPGNSFVEGDPIAGTPRTQVTGAWLTAIQEELASIVEGAGIALSKPNNAQVLSAIDLLARPNQLYRNALINGDFGVWQRGYPTVAIATTVVSFTADRWRATPGTSGGAACSISQFNQTAAQRALTGTRYGLVFQQTTGGNTPYLEQRIEDVVALAGLPMVFSCWACCYSLGSGTSITVGTEVIQNFGPAGSADVVTTGPSFVVPLTASGNPARFSVAITIPSVAGKTYGNNSAHYTAIRLKFPSSLTFALEFYATQFERGLTASPQLVLPPAVELARCQRYLARSYLTLFTEGPTGNGATGVPGQEGAARVIGVGTNGYALDRKLPVPMRAAPTVTWYSPDTGAVGNVFWEGADRAVTGTARTTPADLGYPTVAAARAISDLWAHWVAESEL